MPESFPRYVYKEIDLKLKLIESGFAEKMNEVMKRNKDKRENNDPMVS